MPDLVITDWPTAITALLALLGWVAALTPTEWDDTVLGRVRNLWRLLRLRGR